MRPAFHAKTQSRKVGNEKRGSRMDLNCATRSRRWLVLAHREALADDGVSITALAGLSEFQSSVNGAPHL